MRNWDDGDDSVPDGEATRETEAAFDLALRTAKRANLDFAFATVGSEMRLAFPAEADPTFVAVVRGQSSATGHGKHGSHPHRIAEYREMGCPVWLCYVETGGEVFYSGWLHALPEAHPISKLTGAERYGWNARTDPDAWDRELVRSDGPLSFPDASEIPAPRDDLFAGL